MRPHVVDANVMNGFQQERLLGTVAVAGLAIEAIFAQNYIVLDCTGHCQQEWLECAGGKYPFALSDWIADMFVAQKLRLADLCSDSMHKELKAVGIPKKDHKWVRLAVGAKSEAIITDDIDLFDPSKKGAPSAQVEKLKSSGKGAVSKYLKSKHGIHVVCPASTPDHIASY